jgi:hypothetical protein
MLRVVVANQERAEPVPGGHRRAPAVSNCKRTETVTDEEEELEREEEWE